MRFSIRRSSPCHSRCCFHARSCQSFFTGILLDQFVRMVIAPTIVKIGLDLFEPLLIARTVERGVDLHPKRKTLVVERTSALSTLHSQKAEHFATKSRPLCHKDLTSLSQRADHLAPKTLCLCSKDPMSPTQLFTQCVNFLKHQIEPTQIK